MAAATSAAVASPATTNRPKTRPLSIVPRHSLPLALSFRTAAGATPLKIAAGAACRRPLLVSATAAAGGEAGGGEPVPTTFHGLCYVVKDNIDTDQIIPAEHLTLVPSVPDEYRKLGSLALVGLPAAAYPTPFVAAGDDRTKYSVVIAGYNFGCGSSREHAPVALGAAGARAVVAESYARIFFRNSVATGEIYPLESEGRLCEECATGDLVTVEVEECRLVNHTTGKVYKLKPIGDAGPVIDAGGIFAYARKTGMISSTAA